MWGWCDSEMAIYNQMRVVRKKDTPIKAVEKVPKDSNSQAPRNSGVEAAWTLDLSSHLQGKDMEIIRQNPNFRSKDGW